MDLNTASSVIHFLFNNGYPMIFLIMIFEGPLITYVAAFASSLGFFNVSLILLLSILGNIIPDIIWYGVGRMGGKFSINICQKFFKIDKTRINKVKRYLNKNPGKTITILKLTPFIPPIGLMTTGVMKIPFRKYLFYSVLVSLIYSVFFTVLGFYSGRAFNTISKYIKGIPLTIFLVILILGISWFIFRITFKIISDGIEKYDI